MSDISTISVGDTMSDSTGFCQEECDEESLVDIPSFMLMDMPLMSWVVGTGDVEQSTLSNQNTGGLAINLNSEGVLSKVPQRNTLSVS